MLGMYDDDVSYHNTMVFHHPFKANWWYNLIYTDNFVKVMSDENNISAYENLYKNNYPVDGYFYLGMSYNDEYKFERPINLKLHRPNYALIYNNIIAESIVDNSYYKILKSVYFEESNTKWKTISFKRDEFITIQEKKSSIFRIFN